MSKPTFPCPDCGSDDLIFYDTNEDNKSGRYRCVECGRDTIWKETKSYNIDEVIQKIFEKRGI